MFTKKTKNQVFSHVGVFEKKTSNNRFRLQPNDPTSRKQASKTGPKTFFNQGAKVINFNVFQVIKFWGKKIVKKWDTNFTIKTKERKTV